MRGIVVHIAQKIAYRVHMAPSRAGKSWGFHAAFSTAKVRPFRVLGLQQVAVGAESKDDMRRIWQVRRYCSLTCKIFLFQPELSDAIYHVIDLLLAQDMLGLQKHGEFRSEKENVDEDILTMGRGLATVEIDIMAPLDANKSPKVIYYNDTHCRTLWWWL